MPKERKDKHFIHKPSYPGGPQALKKFISEHLTYPEEAAAAGIKGTVTVDYTINYKGNVIDTKIISGLGYGCDEEATRLVKLLKFDVPKQRARRIRFHKTINIHFRAPARKKTTRQKSGPVSKANTTVHYQISPKSTEKGSPKENGSGGYSYTIEF